MQKIDTRLTDVFIIEPKRFGDHRGWFMETYSAEKLLALGIDTQFVQDNQSFSAQKGTLRELHFQNAPKSQTKLVRCTRGAIIDVAVDIRRGSPQYGQWVAVELTAENGLQLYIPKGFAHGFVTLTDDTEVQYKVDEYYAPDCDRSIRYDDPTFGVDWGFKDPILSDKDLKAPWVQNSDFNFVYEEMI